MHLNCRKTTTTMDKKDKEMLISDLGSRIPYKVKCAYVGWDEDKGEENEMTDVLYAINSDGYVEVFGSMESLPLEHVKPYLFPLSSLTQKQMVEYYNTFFLDDNCNKFLTVESTGWLYKNHIDIYGFIEKGLAIDATDKNIY